MAKRSLTDAEQKVLDLITTNKKSFLRECAKDSQIHMGKIFHSTTGWQMEAYKDLATWNPNLLDQVYCIGRNLWVLICKVDTGLWIDNIDFLIWLSRRYWPLIEKRAQKIKGVRYNTMTEDIRELLARGFIHYEDVDNWEEDYIVKDSGLNLVWPKSFISKHGAQSILEKYGTQGCQVLYIGAI